MIPQPHFWIYSHSKESHYIDDRAASPHSLQPAAETWKQLMCPSEKINEENVYTHTGMSSTNKKQVLSFVITWIDFWTLQ